MTYTTSRRSADLVFSVASEGTDLDPYVVFLVRRLAVYRRYCHKYKKTVGEIQEFYHRYIEKGEPGIYKGEEQLSGKKHGR